MQRLTDIVWPAIAELAVAQIETFRSNKTEYLCIEAAILVEAGWKFLMDEVWVVELSVSEACKRLMARNNLSETEDMQRISSQMSNEARKRHADVVITTEDKTVAEVAEQVKKEYDSFKNRHPISTKDAAASDSSRL